MFSNCLSPLLLLRLKLKGLLLIKTGVIWLHGFHYAFRNIFKNILCHNNGSHGVLCIMHSWDLQKLSIHNISSNLTLLEVCFISWFLYLSSVTLLSLGMLKIKVRHFSKILNMKCWLFYQALHWHSTKYKGRRNIWYLRLIKFTHYL